MTEAVAAEVFRVSPCYLVVFKNNGPITGISDVFAQDLGYAHEELAGVLKIEDILAVGSRVFFQTHFYPLIRLHGVYNELFLTFRAKNGEEIPVLLNGRLIEGDDGPFISCGGIRITKRNRYEQELVEARRAAEKANSQNVELQRTREELSQNQELLEMRLRKLTQMLRQQQEINTVISHDLQEPLRKISTFGKMLRSDTALIKNSVSLNYLDKLIFSADHMRMLIQSTQQFLSLSENKFRPQPVKLAALIGDVAKTMLSNQDVELKYDVEAAPEVFADAILLRQLLEELFTNALKFRDQTKDHLKIELVADVVDENVFREVAHRYRYGQFTRLVVSDNGAGFSPALHEEVFKLFRRAHYMGEGYGVGLALCRKIVELHHGWITVESRVGVGTKFTILLPLQSTPAPGTYRPETAAN